MAEVRVGGLFAAAFPGTVADLAWSSKWGSGGCGPDAASWSQDLPFTFDDARLRPGVSVDVVRGGQKLWTGFLTDVQRGDRWTFQASGLASLAERFVALDGTGAPTTNPQTAATQAVTRGLAWSGASVFPSATFGDGSAVQANTLGSLLTAYHDANYLRWGVNRYGAAFSQADPTGTPRWVLDGRDVELGVAEDSLYTAVVARYQTATTPTYATTTVTNASAIATYGRRELLLNLTNLGVITGATATSYANQALTAAIVPTWLNSLTVTADTLRTFGGTPADLPAVRAGHLVRVMSVPGRLGRLSGSAVMDIPLGAVSYTDGSDQLQIAPTKLARRTLRDVIDALERTPDSGTTSFLR